MEYKDFEALLKITNSELERVGSHFKIEVSEEDLYLILNTVWREKQKEISLDRTGKILLSDAFSRLEGILLGLKLAKI